MHVAQSQKVALGQQWSRHREQTYGQGGGRGGRRGAWMERVTGIYRTVCKTASQRGFAV